MVYKKNIDLKAYFKYKKMFPFVIHKTQHLGTNNYTQSQENEKNYTYMNNMKLI